MEGIVSPKYKPRIIDKTLARYLEIFGALCIEGPKWCGKTRTFSYHRNSEILIGVPSNNFQNKHLAELFLLVWEMQHTKEMMECMLFQLTH